MPEAAIVENIERKSPHYYERELLREAMTCRYGRNEISHAACDGVYEYEAAIEKETPL
jgi:hypothetical protein